MPLTISGLLMTLATPFWLAAPVLPPDVHSTTATKKTMSHSWVSWILA